MDSAVASKYTIEPPDAPQNKYTVEPPTPAPKAIPPNIPPKAPGFLDSVNSSLGYKPDDGMVMKGLKTVGQAIAGPTTEIANTIGGIADIPKSTQIGENAPNDEYAVGKMTSLPGTNTSLGLPIYKAAKGIAGQAKDSVVAGYNAQKQGEGLPGVALSELEKAPLIGDLVQKMEHGQGVSAVTQGVARAALMKGATKTPELQNIATAEGNPGVVYSQYLTPVSHVPMEMPQMTPKIQSALINKIEINYPEVAKRVRSGETTIGDLDIARQVANDSSKAAYTTRGLPTQISQGFKNAADGLRDTIYPKIEALHNLPEGSLGDLKRIQGSAIEMGKPPKWGHFPSRWPTVAAERLAIRPTMDAVRNVKTRIADSVLPEPQSIDLRRNFPPPRGQMVKSIQPASVEIGGPQAVSGRPPQGGITPMNTEHMGAEPALYRPPPAQVGSPTTRPSGPPAVIPRIAPQASPLPAVPKEMLNLPRTILDEIEEQHAQGRLGPKVQNRPSVSSR